jgi:hypothetical protein
MLRRLETLNEMEANLEKVWVVLEKWVELLSGNENFAGRDL